MKPWHPSFKPFEETPTIALIWVCLSEFPSKYWYNEVFESIGDTLGEYHFAFDHILERKSTSYARICVQLDLLKLLPAQIRLHLPKDDLDYEQNLDYENVPFRCRICSKYSHLTHGYLATPPKPTPQEASLDGFQ